VGGEPPAVANEAGPTPRQLWVCAANKADFARIVRECRESHRAACGDDSDLLLGLQLTHSGRYSYPRPLIAVRDPLLDPRHAVIDYSYPVLSDDYLAGLVDRYVAAAKLARDAGFDFVDIKQCHRYLLNELLAAKTRPGRYGGTLENRTRLARDIIAAIRAAVPDLILAVRINVFDGIPFVKG